MIQVLSESKPIARKQYRCMAFDILDVCDVDPELLPLHERLAMIKARERGGKILPGERYVNQRNLDDGVFYTFRAIPELDEICLKYELYETD